MKQLKEMSMRIKIAKTSLLSVEKLVNSELLPVLFALIRKILSHFSFASHSYSCFIATFDKRQAKANT